MAATWHWHQLYLLKRIHHTPDTLGTLPDIAANARPLRAWLKCRAITTHARESVTDLSRNCKGFCSRESVHARVTESRAQGTGVGRDIRQSPSRVRSVFLLIYGIHSFHTLRVHYANAVASLMWWCPKSWKYAKVARVHYFFYNCTLRNFKHLSQCLRARERRVWLIDLLHG